MNLNELAESLKINLSSALSVFGNNETLYVRFLKKFPTDKTFDILVDAVSSKNYGDIEKSAHTLKGICANLGINEIKNKSDEIVTAVRNNNYEDIESLFNSLKCEYEKTVTAIDSME